MDTSTLKNELIEAFTSKGVLEDKNLQTELAWVSESLGELTVIVKNEYYLSVARMLKQRFGFEIMVDLCAVDYSTYGQSDFDERAQNTGFSRAKVKQHDTAKNPTPSALNHINHRFWVVIHLLSIKHNQRLRLKVPATLIEGTDLVSVESITTIWPVADWYEREAFDLFGVIFLNHPDLRRILLDYNFQGHPLRKDFPLEGEVEVSYDDDQQRVKYRPVSIDGRMNHARVIRADKPNHSNLPHSNDGNELENSSLS